MGNNMVAGSSGKAAKVMKINGECFKLKTPIRVFDVIKDYPDHVLLDSEEFLRFNLRAKPLNWDDELKPRKIYLLVELPEFPDKKQSPLRKVRSGVLATTATKVYRRSVSDDLTLDARSAVARRFGNNGGPLLGGRSGDVGPTRVKMRLPKSQVQKIMDESGDNNGEVAKKIFNLCLEENAVVSCRETVVEEDECGGAAGGGRHFYRGKYKKLTS